MIENLLTINLSLQLLGAGAVVYIVQKFIDTLTSHIFDKKIFYPIFSSIKKRWKILKTNAKPVKATFSLSYTPEENLSVSSTTERLKRTFHKVEDSSNGKITIDDEYWSVSERRGKVEFHYSDQRESFTANINLVRDTECVKSTPSGDPDEVNVGSIGLEIGFKFPFKQLEDTLFNLGSLISYLEAGFESQIRGNFSSGRFVITPVNTDLTIDEWVEEEQFDISLLLATEGQDRTEVEFFSDRAIVKSNQREIDAKTVKYMKELLLNYYL